METKVEAEWMKLPCPAVGPRAVRRTRSGVLRRFWILSAIAALFGTVAIATFAELRPMETLARDGKVYKAVVVSRIPYTLDRTAETQSALLYDVEISGRKFRFSELAPRELLGIGKGQEFLITALPTNPSAHVSGIIDKEAIQNQHNLADFVVIVGLLALAFAAYIEHLIFAKQAKMLRGFNGVPAFVSLASESGIDGFRHQEITFRYLDSNDKVNELGAQPINRNLKVGQRMVLFVDPAGIESPVLPWDHPLVELDL